MPGRTPARQQHLDSGARKAGYRNFEEMAAYLKQRQRRPAPTKPAPAGNFFAELWNNPGRVLRSAFSWHPANTIGRSSDKLRRAQKR